MEARRGEAMSSLTNLAQLQEKYFLDNNSYAANRNILGVDQKTFDENYQISMQLLDNDENFVILAQPVSGSAQAEDTECLAMRIYGDGRRTPS